MEEETFYVKFANRFAVHRFQDAIDHVASALEDAPWNVDLLEAKQALDDAWNGLSFGAQG
jgi:hypothetical protein